jgi:hypothetical protein
MKETGGKASLLSLTGYAKTASIIGKYSNIGITVCKAGFPRYPRRTGNGCSENRGTFLPAAGNFFQYPLHFLIYSFDMPIFNIEGDFKMSNSEIAVLDLRKNRPTDGFPKADFKINRVLKLDQ